MMTLQACLLDTNVCSCKTTGAYSYRKFYAFYRPTGNTCVSVYLYGYLLNRCMHIHVCIRIFTRSVHAIMHVCQHTCSNISTCVAILPHRRALLHPHHALPSHRRWLHRLGSSRILNSLQQHKQQVETEGHLRLHTQMAQHQAGEIIFLNIARQT